MSRDTQAFVSACSIYACSTNLQLACCAFHPSPTDPGLTLDIGLPPSNGNIKILTIVDCFSKAVHFAPLSKLPSASETVSGLESRVFLLHGILQDIVSNRGPQFSSQVWKSFCQTLGTTASLSSGYHSQMNRQIGRANQDLDSTIYCFTDCHPTFWSILPQWIEYAHNSRISSATDMSPFMTLLGFQCPLFPAHEETVSVPSVQLSPVLSCLKSRTGHP